MRKYTTTDYQWITKTEKEGFLNIVQQIDKMLKNN